MIVLTDAFMHRDGVIHKPRAIEEGGGLAKTMGHGHHEICSF